MIIKFEKQGEEVIDGKTEKVNFWTEVAKEADADFIHFCGHDTNQPQPCRRVKK
jgi:hypothetical protein